MALREYQTRAVEELRKAILNGSRRICLYSPTGSGKTEIAIELLRRADAKGKRMMFVANRVELIGQASRRLSKSLMPHGILQGANTTASTHHVLVASIHTMARRGFPDNVDLIVIDEAHAAPGSKAYKELLARIKVPVIGLTATPFTRGMGRDDPQIGGPVFEKIVAATTIADLIREGHLVDVDIYAPSEPDLEGVKITGGDYNERQLGERVDREELVGDIVEHWLKMAGGKPTVCFATNIAHSQHIVQQFKKAGVSAEHLDCYTDDSERRAIIGRLESGQTKVVSNVSVLAEGWDCPSVGVMILARPTRSLTRYIQMVGRALRPHAGKERALVLDHSGSCRRFPYPTSDLPLKLDKGEKKEADKQDREYEEKKPHKCPRCSFIKPPGTWRCPSCGFEPERPPSDIRAKDGELVQFIKATPQDKQRFWSELQFVGAKRGYSKGRMAHLYRAKFSVWPRGLSDQPIPATPETLNFITSRNIAYAKRMSPRHAMRHTPTAELQLN